MALNIFLKGCENYLGMFFKFSCGTVLLVAASSHTSCQYLN